MSQARAKQINLEPHIYEKISKKGISRPVVESVVMHGRKVKNSPSHYTKFSLLGYVVVMHGRRVVSAFYNRGLE